MGPGVQKVTVNFRYWRTRLRLRRRGAQQVPGRPVCRLAASEVPAPSCSTVTADLGQLAPTQEFPRGKQAHHLPVLLFLWLPNSRALMKQLPFQGKIPGRFSRESPEHLQPRQTWLLGDDIWIQAENSEL